MPNPVVHFEILGPDSGALQQFYGDLFGWKIDASNPMSYGMVDTGEGNPGGGITQGQNGDRGVTFYIQVDDLQARPRPGREGRRPHRGAGHRDPGHGHVRPVRRPRRQRGGSRQELTRVTARASAAT